MPNYTNVLQINGDIKGIPYSGTGEIRPDGDANYGFKPLKGCPEALDTIPELQRDPALRELVASINQAQTGLFSVGCVSGPVDEEKGHRVTGYVEFALNNVEAAQDAVHYFPIFFHFDGMLRQSGFSESVHYHWELMGANFRAVDVVGFTMSVTVNTGFHETPEAARVTWAAGLDALAFFLAQVGAEPGPQIYGGDADGTGATPSLS